MTWTQQQLSEHLAKPKKPRRSPLHMKNPPVKISEKKRQTSMITALRSRGYVVQELGQRRVPIFCSCGKKLWQAVTMNTDGVGDWQVTHPRWPGVWLQFETKTPDTPRRAAQIANAEAGYTVIVETLQEVLEAVLHLERQWEIAPLPGVTAYLEQMD